MDLDREFTTGWKVEKYRYYANDLHRMIGVADAPGRVSLSNIGCNGENLTIAVLSIESCGCDDPPDGFHREVYSEFRGRIFDRR